MPNEHVSKQFDQDLTSVQTQVLQMGGLAEQAFRNAVHAFATGDTTLVDRVHADEKRINALEIEIDSALVRVVALRQPAAGDLRMIMGMSRVVTDLERVGDEASKIARLSKQVHDKGWTLGFRASELRRAADIAGMMLRESLDSLARLDASQTSKIMQDDRNIDNEFQGMLRLLITFVMEDPRTISTALDTMLAAKAVERIGDHAKNIAEHVVYIVQGKDVRHPDAMTQDATSL